VWVALTGAGILIFAVRRTSGDPASTPSSTRAIVRDLVDAGRAAPVTRAYSPRSAVEVTRATSFTRSRLPVRRGGFPRHSRRDGRRSLGPAPFFAWERGGTPGRRQQRWMALPPTRSFRRPSVLLLSARPGPAHDVWLAARRGARRRRGRAARRETPARDPRAAGGAGGVVRPPGVAVRVEEAASLVGHRRSGYDLIPACGLESWA